MAVLEIAMYGPAAPSKVSTEKEVRWLLLMKLRPKALSRDCSVQPIG
jgi:hypothetical protein